jgi:hypothetical protein
MLTWNAQHHINAESPNVHLSNRVKMPSMASDLRQYVRATQSVQICRSVQFEQLATAWRSGPHEISSSSQPARDQSVVNAAILAAVEGMKPLEAQSGDVVTRMVNERDQCNDSRAISRARRSEVDRTRRDRPIAGKMASGLVDIMPPTVLDPLFHRLVDRPHDSAGNTDH